MSTGIQMRKRPSAQGLCRGEQAGEELLKSRWPPITVRNLYVLPLQIRRDVDGGHGAAPPGAAFVHRGDLRHALTVAATQRVVELSRQKGATQSIGETLDERSFVNHCRTRTAGSSAITLRLPAMAAAAGSILLGRILPIFRRSPRCWPGSIKWQRH